MKSRSSLYGFVVGILLFISIVCLDCSPKATARSQSNDENAIRFLVGRLFELYQRKDLNGMLALWSEKSPFFAGNKKTLEEEFIRNEKIVVKGFEIRKLLIEGEHATLRVIVDVALTKAKAASAVEKVEKMNRTLHLAIENGSWKVWKFILSEEELVDAIAAAKTEAEWNALIASEPELITSGLVIALIRRNSINTGNQVHYQRALAINQLGYKLAERIDDKFAMGVVLNNAASIYGWLGTPKKSPEKALEYLEKSIKIGEEHGLKEVVARSLTNAAIMYQALGDTIRAKEYFERVSKLSEELGDATLNARAMNNLGVIYRNRGDYAKALECYLKSQKLSESKLDTGESYYILAATLGSISTIFQIQGNNEQSLTFVRRAYEAAEKGAALGYHPANQSMAEQLSSMGDIYRLQGNYSLAMEYFQKCLNMVGEFRTAPAGYQESFTSSVKTFIGATFADQEKPLQAIASYTEAFKLAEGIDNRTRMIITLWNLGNAYVSQGNYREALAAEERAIEMAEKNSHFQFLCWALVTAAKAYRGLGRTDEARHALVRAINITEDLREQLTGGELDRQYSLEQTMAPYQTIIDLEIDQKRYAKAFSYAQQAKGRTLLQLLQNGRVNITKSISAAEREEEQRLSRKIVSLNRQITDEKLKSQLDKKGFGEFEEQLKKARLEFEAFQTNLYAAHTELKTQRGEIRPVSFDDAASLIPDTKTALLDFIVTDENIQSFVLTRDASAQVALNTYTVKIKRKSLAEAVERFRGRLANRDFDYQSLSNQLYGLLLKPAQKQLENKTTLIVSPDGVLWDLPFQVLQSEKGRYLIEDAAISYTPSLSVLREMRGMRQRRRSPAPASLLALGNPMVGKQNLDLMKFIWMDEELRPLPDAGRQVEALERLYGKTLSKVYVGPAAREEIVKQESARYRILHLATHGIFNDASPMYSHVILSQTPGKTEEDGLLEAWEIMNLELNADLVVLSACETARGRVSAGEGVIGLTWALFVAGCPTTVVSQWKVESSSTTALMVEFHTRFKTRFDSPQSATTTAEALRQAALKLMRNKDYRHPFFWGGFVVVGDGS